MLKKEGLLVKRLNHALKLHRQRVSLAVHLFTHRHLDPPLTDAVFLDIKALFVVEFNAHVMLKNGSDMKWAAGVGGEVVWESGFGGFGHGEILIVKQLPSTPLAFSEQWLARFLQHQSVHVYPAPTLAKCELKRPKAWQIWLG